MPTIYHPSLASWQAESPIGPLVARADFSDTTEITTYSQRYTVLALSYAAPSINAATVINSVTYYLTGDVGFSSNQMALEFTREWSRIPSDRVEYGSRPIEHPGESFQVLLLTYNIPPRTLFTPTRTTYRYYLAGVNVTTVSDIPLLQQFRVSLDVGGGNTVDNNMITTNATSPSRSVYAALVSAGGYSLVLEDSLRRWRGEIIERQTIEYIPR
jgi:hypothetical protein